MTAFKYPPRGANHCGPGEVARPIFGLDIDGTLGLYHEHFVRFAEAYLGRSLPPGAAYSGGSFSSYLGLGKQTYRRIKLAYRRGGAKRSMPAVAGAADLTASLRARGAVVLLCTTRPYLSMENIDDDTRHWAKRNGIQHDGIEWGQWKWRDLSRFNGRVVSILEDEPDLMRQGVEHGLLVNRIIRPYNSGSFDYNGWSCEDLEVALFVMTKQLNDWEMRNAQA